MTFVNDIPLGANVVVVTLSSVLGLGVLGTRTTLTGAGDVAVGTVGTPCGNVGKNAFKKSLKGELAGLNVSCALTCITDNTAISHTRHHNTTVFSIEKVVNEEVR